MYVPPTDKLLHFAAGTLAALPGAALQLLDPGLLVRPWAGALITCAVAAVLREVWNAYQGGFFDWRDVAATMAGGASVAAGAWLGGCNGS